LTVTNKLIFPTQR